MPTVSGNQPHLVGRGSGGSTGVPTGALDFSDPLDSGWGGVDEPEVYGAPLTNDLY